MAFGGTLSLQAQSGSAPVGVMSYTVAENATISLGVPLLRPALAVGTVGTVNGATLVFAGTDPVSSIALVPGESCFIEVIAHVDGTATALLGERFEVDEAATRAAAPGSVVLDLESPLNTSAAAGVSGLAGYRIAVRPHWTLTALLGTGRTAKVNAAIAAAGADQVLVWNGSGFSVYYLRAGEEPQWRNAATGSLNQNGAIIPPGTGVFLRRRAGSLTFTVAGEVRTNRFVLPPFAASQLLAGGFPVATSPANWKLAGGAGLTAGTSPLNSDRLLTWAGSAFQTYFLSNAVTPQWRSTATGLLDFTHAQLFPAGGASLLLLRAAAAGNPPPPLAQAVPFSL